MPIVSKNPATEEIIKEYQSLTESELKDRLDKAHDTFNSWKYTSLEERKNLFKKLAEYLRENKDELGKNLTMEMGKPLSNAAKEMEKSAWNADYYIENIDEMLKNEHIDTERKENYIKFEPLGIILLVMPWNFPFWQVLRQAIPTIMGGNTVVLKHASNVPASALSIEKIFKEVGFPDGVFQTLLIGSSMVENVLADFRVKGVSLTGSEGAGSAVASLAGKYIKKSVMELGGNDALIVLKDGDATKAATTCTAARLRNSGQVCNSPKRPIIVKEKLDEFLEVLKQKFESTVVGDPLNPDTDMGPLSSQQILEETEKQVDDSVAKGAKLILGGKKIGEKGYFYEPTILLLNPDGMSIDELMQKDMPAYNEEIFGPVSSVIVVENEEEAIKVANDTKFGLTASIWSADESHAKELIPHINSGSVAINGVVSSDPRLPFGGINNAGYGREISRYGLLEFMNLKTIYVYE